VTLFVGQIVETQQRAEGREAIVRVRGARQVVVLDAVPDARVGDTVLVEAGAAVAVVRGVETTPLEQEGSPCA
jgi:hydrogenase maturation factor